MQLGTLVFKLLQKLNYILISPATVSGVVSEQIESFYDPVFYEIMNNDEVRNKAYRKVINENVKDKIVVEVGTGNALTLTKMCSDAGARKVYTIEAKQESYEASKTLIESLGLTEKIKIIQGISTEIEIEEKADIFLHEIIGDIGSDEGSVLVSNDARKRFLKSDAKFIPYQCITKICPVSPLKLSLLDKIANLIDGFTYNSPIWEANLSGTFPTGGYYVYNFPKSNIISAPQEFENLLFSREIATLESKISIFHVDKQGLFDGFILYIELFVDSETVVNSLDKKTNWGTRYIKMFDPPVHLSVGDEIKVETTRDVSTDTSKYEIRVSVARSESKSVLNSQFAW